jgi:hypothetical protein
VGTVGLLSNYRFCFLVSAALLAAVQTGAAQTSQPDMPRNLINPVLVPYAQGMADMEARAAAGPQAVQPMLPEPRAGTPGPKPASPVLNPQTSGPR